jgi:hypothetical protein
MRTAYPETCISSGCDGASYCRGYCYRHYEEHRTAGTIPVRKFGASKAERVWRFVEKREDHECWPWTGGSVVGGYGIVVLEGGKRERAHRAMWEITYGPIPPSDAYHGTVVMHKCDNRICVNPSHLQLGTHQDNMADRTAKGRGVIPRKFEKGAKHLLASPKLNDDAIRDIRSGQLSPKETALKYDLDVRNVYNIRSRKTWKHVA